MEKLLKIRLIDLSIVLSIAFLPAIIKSIYVLVCGPIKYYPDQLDITFLIGTVERILSILLLVYVLFKRNKTCKGLGLEINFKEIVYGIGLGMVATVVFSLSWYILRAMLPLAYTNKLTARNISFLSDHFSWPFLIYVLVNPFFEELIVRGYLMTEIYFLSKSKVLAITISVLLQAIYHLYQGILPTLLLASVFLIYSIFYSKTGKLTPVIVAHLIADLAILARSK